MPENIPDFGGVKVGQTVYGDCPNCGYTKALAITRTGERMLFHCHAGCAQDELWRTVHGHEPPVAAPGERRQIGCGTTSNFILSMWKQSQPALGTVVETYLANRGIVGSVASIRFFPDHLHRPTGTNWPVMLAAVTDCSGRLHAVHRTYLAPDGSGKAPVQPAKMSLGPVGGLSCHLAAPGTHLAVAEGIETGLSVQHATGIPTWAALSAGGMRNLILPKLPHATFVTIAADADQVGIHSAQFAAERWISEGRKVRIVLPKLGKDFNDVLRATV